MTRNRLIAIAAAAALVVVLVGVAAGGAFDRDDDKVAKPAVTETAVVLPAGPTPEALQLQIYERAFSECASTDPQLLKGKYKLARDTDAQLAIGVGIGWAKFFKAGQDAVEDGRQGCLHGFARKRADDASG
jgi:hypothetical protein